MHLRRVLLLVHVDVVNLHILKHIDARLLFNLRDYFGNAYLIFVGFATALLAYLPYVVPVH